MNSAGARNRPPVRNRASRRSPPAGGGAATTGGSTVMIPPELTDLLGALVGRGCRRLQLLGDPGGVARVLEEALEQPPLALAGGGAERGRLLVGHVEDDVLGRPHRLLVGAVDGVRVHA